jgi:hypothetical protein
MKTGGIWIVLGTLVLVPLLGFSTVELLQRHRFERMREEIATVAYSLNGAKLGRGAGGIAFLPDGAAAEAQYQAGVGINLEDAERWVMWSLSAKSPNSTKLDEFWLTATVVIMIRQNRKGFLRSPRVSVIMPRPPHPAIAAKIDTLLKSRGIEYELVDALP